MGSWERTACCRYVSTSSTFADTHVWLIADPAVLEREEVAKRAKNKLPSPSSYGKPTGEGGWTDRRLQVLQECMCFHRFAHDADKQPTPVVLLDPILAQVSYDCEYGTPSDADCKFAALVALTMSAAYDNEELRMRKFWELLGKEFDVTFVSAKYDSAVTDGSVLHLGGLLVNIQVKNEIGSGGGAIHVQNAAYAAAHAFQADRVRRISVCPTLLVELAGPNMSLSGAVFTTIATCDQLSPMISLLWQPHSRLMLQAARCFAAIRKALPSLRSFYEELDEEALKHQAPKRQLEYPYSASFTGPQGTAMQLHYTDKLSNTCFKATVDGEKGIVLVKFCKSYSKDAHTCLASDRHAPAFLGIESLADEWLMVVMEYVTGCLWHEAMDKPFAELQAAVHLLHKAGFVHGDLRSNNIIVVSGTVRIIDFEWAGVADEAVYPFFMNHTDMEWPDGARDRQPIKQEHDLWWLNLLCNESATS